MKRFPSPSIIGAITAFILTASSAKSATITFDDLADPGGGTPVPVGYGGLAWSNFYSANSQASFPGSGYVAGTVSANNILYNGFGNSASLSSTEPFNLVSAYLTGAWNNGLQVTVTGFNGATQVATQTVTTSAFAPTLFTFNFNNITSVAFSASGGIDVPAYGGSGTHFAMDNLMITAVPEPSALMLVMCAGAGMFLRRKR